MNKMADFTIYEQHLWSDDSLQVTGDLLDKFDYGLLDSPDIRIRKVAIFWIAILISRPRINKSVNVRHATSGAACKVKAINMRIPFVERDSLLFFQKNSTTENDFRLQKLICTTVSEGKYQLVDRYLLARFNNDAARPSAKGCIDLSKINKNMPQLRLMASESPDPMADRCVMMLDPSWKYARHIEYVRIGGGEEEIPSCSTSESSSICSSNDKPNAKREEFRSDQVSGEGIGLVNSIGSQSIKRSKQVTIVPKLTLKLQSSSGLEQQKEIYSAVDSPSSNIIRINRPLKRSLIVHPNTSETGKMSSQQPGSYSPRKHANFKITTSKIQSTKAMTPKFRPSNLPPITDRNIHYKHQKTPQIERSQLKHDMTFSSLIALRQKNSSKPTIM